jgi:hypothetical protein
VGECHIYFLMDKMYAPEDEKGDEERTKEDERDDDERTTEDEGVKREQKTREMMREQQKRRE